MIAPSDGARNKFPWSRGSDGGRCWPVRSTTTEVTSEAPGKFVPSSSTRAIIIVTAYVMLCAGICHFQAHGCDNNNHIVSINLKNVLI